VKVPRWTVDPGSVYYPESRVTTCPLHEVSTHQGCFFHHPSCLSYHSIRSQYKVQHLHHSRWVSCSVQRLVHRVHPAHHYHPQSSQIQPVTCLSRNQSQLTLVSMVIQGMFWKLCKEKLNLFQKVSWMNYFFNTHLLKYSKTSLHQL